MKLLLINSIYKPYVGGGAEIVFEDHVQGFKERGYDVEVLSLAKDGIFKIEEIDGVKVYRIPVKNLYWPDPQSKPNGLIRKIWHIFDMYNFLMRKSVSKVLKMASPDIVVCHNIPGFSVSLWSAANRLNIPIVQVLHDLSFLCPGSNMFKGETPCKGQCLVCKCMRLFHPLLSKNVNVVVGVSQFVINRFERYDYFPNAKKYVINNYRNLLAPKIKEYNNDTFNVGYIGVLSKVKGLELLINQFKEIKEQNITLKIAGKGISIEYEAYLKDLASGDNRIQFMGYVKQTEFFSKIDALVVPSLWPDTFPTVAIESCACSVPVLASKEGGLPEIVHHKKNGLLFDVFAPNAIKDNILTLYNDKELYDNLKSNCQTEVNELFDKRRVFDQYKKIFDELIIQYENCN